MKTQVRPTRARRAHLVDQALEWADRTSGAHGISQAALRRSLPARDRRSNCYVSRIVQLGRALRGLPPLEFALYRDPKLTYRVVSQVVRGNRTPAEIRSLLRQAIVAPPHMRSPRRRRSVAPVLSEVGGQPSISGWEWNSRQALAHPEAEVRSFIAFVARLHAAATVGLQLAINRRHAPMTLAGQSIGMLMRSIDTYRKAQTTDDRQEIVRLSPSEHEAVAMLETLRRSLSALGHETTSE